MASCSKSLLILFFVFLPYLCFSHPLPLHQHSPFGFLNRLQGCKKGDNIKGISHLKSYFRHFGYFKDRKNATGGHLIDNDDVFDDLLESAIKTYQLFFHLNSTGSLNAETVSQLTTSRCGVPDIVDGAARRMQSEGQGGHEHHHHIVSHYSFFPRRQRWPPSKYHLTYAFLPGTRTDAMAPVARAFNTWAQNTHFTFSLATHYKRADLKIAFFRGNHHDNHPFDGPGGIIAHAFAPTDGRFHFDAAETWAVGPMRGEHDMETVALHEIGHLLGLGHSTVKNAIMYPTIMTGTIKGLNADDIKGIKALYNIH